MSEVATWQVILVDDEPDSLELISEMLIHEGATVYRAASGDECLALLDDITPTLMVVDLAMPHPDGWDLLNHVRTTPTLADTYMVAVTAYHTPQVENQAHEVGFNAYLAKPLRSHALMDTLRDLIG